MSIQDEILRATGGPTVNDGLAVHFGKTATESLQDAERRWLGGDEALAPVQQLNDLWIANYGPGQINDVKLAYWSGQ